MELLQLQNYLISSFEKKSYAKKLQDKELLEFMELLQLQKVWNSFEKNFKVI